MTLHTGSTGPVIRADTFEPEVLRQIVQAELGGISNIPGIVGFGDFAVTQNGTPNMSVNVAAGFAFIAGTNNAPAQGLYHAYNDGSVNLSIAAANATNPRVDIVCLTVRDAFYSGGNNDVILQVITGTAAVSPAVPSAPANSIVLAHIYVGANVTSITNSNINSTTGTNNPDTTAYQAPWCGSTQQPRGILQGGYAQVTANQGSITAVVDLTGLSITVTVGAGRRIRVSGHVIMSNTAIGNCVVYIYEGGTQLQEHIITCAAANGFTTNTPSVILQPSAGTHTYKLRAQASSGTGSTTALAIDPAWIMAEDIGAW